VAEHTIAERMLAAAAELAGCRVYKVDAVELTMMGSTLSTTRSAEPYANLLRLAAALAQVAGDLRCHFAHDPECESSRVLDWDSSTGPCTCGLAALEARLASLQRGELPGEEHGG
jgi:hypothetical protein